MPPKWTSTLWTWVPVVLAVGFIVWGVELFLSARADQQQLHRDVEFVSRLHELTRATRDLGHAQVGDEPTWREHQDRFHQKMAEVRNYHAEAAVVEPSLQELESQERQLASLRTAGRHDDANVVRGLATTLRKLDDARDSIRARSRSISNDLAGKWNQLHVLVAIACLLALVVAFVFHLYRRNVIERNKAQVTLVRRERFIERIAEASPNLIGVFDLQAHRMVYINRKSESLLGFSPADLQATGENVTACVTHPEDMDRVSEFLARCERAQEGEVLEVETRVSDGTGSWRWLTGSATVFTRTPDGRVHEIIGTASDITDRKRLEEQYLHAQKMEAVGQLAGGVAHDFNNLLTVINGYCDLLLNADPDNPGREFVHEVQKAGTRATSLTRQLLAFGRRQVLQPVILDLNSVVSDTEKMLRRLIGADIELAPQLAENLRSVKVDPGQMEQVLMNLAVNARDAMPRGGKFSITTSNVALARDRERPEIRPGEYICLAVRDSGCGMDAVTLIKIFEPFFTTKPVGKGTGLGLATVYGIVKQSGGYIYVESEVDRGTTFTIYLPAVAELATSPVALPSMNSLPRATETVLLVEDEDAVRKLARQILELYGYTVLEGRHGGEGLKLSREHVGNIDILVTDMVMPIIDGAELARRLRKDRPDLKVLFITGYTESALARRRMSKDDGKLLVKPFQPEKFARTIREVLDGNGIGGIVSLEQAQEQLVT